MITKKFFFSINDMSFLELGFKKIKKYYILETKNMFNIFMFLSSNYSDCYYIDYNVIIKAVHPSINLSNITEKQFDLVLQPRLTLCNGTVELRLNDLECEDYKSILKKTISHFIVKFERSDIKFLKEIIIDCDCIVSKGACEFLDKV